MACTCCVQYWGSGAEIGCRAGSKDTEAETDGRRTDRQGWTPAGRSSRPKKWGGELRGWGSSQSIRSQDPTLPEWPGTLSAGFCGREAVGWRMLGRMAGGAIRNRSRYRCRRARIGPCRRARLCQQPPSTKFGLRSRAQLEAARWGHCVVMPGQAPIVAPGHLGQTSPLWPGNER
ncbi:hypothetical protein RB597_006558 [Gaeumannomyces tritici]